jgi:1-deoxy-D-xylulose-5-phosphate reductoisomerase
MSDTARVLILGSTGSIGTQTLAVIGHLNALHARGESPTRFEVVGLAARRNAALLREQVAHWHVGHAALVENGDAAPTPAHLRRGPDAPERLVREVECDVVVAAMVGIAGLPPTLAAVELGRTVALANKETLVAGGGLVTAIAKRSCAAILPVDSEHAALWQCLPGDRTAPPLSAPSSVARAVITASGGPFRARSAQDVYDATPEEALRHPTWTMGPKVTIDSATLMNKALELIEAHWLFGLEADRLGVLIHPQSIVHALVETTDGQVFAHLAAPDMRTPIQHALTYPRRAAACTASLPLAGLSRLDFAVPDVGRFPALRLGFEAVGAGGAAGAVLNAANEVAVEAFLARRLAFGRITEVTERVTREIVPSPAGTLSEILDADGAARTCARRLISD